jgi:hypothetical protein
MILQYPYLKHKKSPSFFGWFVQYTQNVGHKINMFNKKNDEEKK